MEHLIYSICYGNCEFLNTCEYDIGDYRSNQLLREIPGGLDSMLVPILDNVMVEILNSVMVAILDTVMVAMPKKRRAARGGVSGWDRDGVGRAEEEGRGGKQSVNHQLHNHTKLLAAQPHPNIATACPQLGRGVKLHQLHHTTIVNTMSCAKKSSWT